MRPWGYTLAIAALQAATRCLMVAAVGELVLAARGW